MDENKVMTVPFDYELRQEENNKGIFEGYGSTFGGEPDAYNDIIEAGAFQDTLIAGGRNGNGIAMLWQHDSDRPVGRWLELFENEKGLKTKGMLALEATDGKDMYSLMKIKAIQGLSIGFRPLVYEYEIINDEKRIRHIKKAQLWEISPVVFPANLKANITDVKAAIENASNERELEAFLKQAGLTNSAAKYITSLIKDKFFRREAVNEISLKEILGALKRVNSEINF